MSAYDASAIEVLSGRAGAQTPRHVHGTRRDRNHLAQEVIDNSVDEAIAGYAKQIEVTLFRDGSVEVMTMVADVGRHPPRTG